MQQLFYCSLGTYDSLKKNKPTDVHCPRCDGEGVIYKGFTISGVQNLVKEIVEICPSCRKTGTTPIPLSEIL